jgi:hypothetical protein
MGMSRSIEAFSWAAIWSLILMMAAAFSCNEKPIGRDVMSLRLTNQINGWTEVPDGGYFPFADFSRMYDVINGAASLYDAHGVRSGFLQAMKDVSGKEITMLVCDFVMEESAQTMFTAKDTTIASPLSVGTFNQNTVVAAGTLGGIMAYGHCGRFYYELSFTGYAVSDSALPDASEFSTYFQTSPSKY